MTSTPSEIISELCECGKPLHLRGFCVACYYRLKRNSPERLLPRKWRHILSNIDVENKTATCSTCGVIRLQRRDAKSWRCPTASREKSREYKRAYRQSKKAMMLHHCEICGSVDSLCWDHCHTQNIFRGTLCSNCNKALGLFKDEIDTLLNAIEYLKKFNEKSSSPL